MSALGLIALTALRRFLAHIVRIGHRTALKSEHIARITSAEICVVYHRVVEQELIKVTAPFEVRDRNAERARVRRCGVFSIDNRLRNIPTLKEPDTYPPTRPLHDIDPTAINIKLRATPMRRPRPHSTASISSALITIIVLQLPGHMRASNRAARQRVHRDQIRRAVVRELHDIDLARARPRSAPHRPPRGPRAADITRHVRQIQHEEAVGPTLLGLEAKAQAAEVGGRVQDLRGFDAPAGGVGRVTDHAVLLGGGAVDVVDVAVRGVPGGVEVEVVEEGGAGEVALKLVSLGCGECGDNCQEDCRLHRGLVGV